MFGFGKSKNAPGRVPRDAQLADVDVPRVDFLVVGAMKCGTTTLRRALGAHSDIHMPDGEQHFFGNRQRYLSVWKNGTIDRAAFESTYAAQFRSDRKRIGGKTPNYIISTLTIERIQRFHPHAKMVFMTRCPIDRAQSHWNHMLRQRERGQRPASLVGETFDAHVAKDREELQYARHPAAEVRGANILWRGMYAAQLTNLRHFFPSERIFVGAVEDMRADSTAFLRGLSAFLDVDFDPAMAEAADAGEARAPGHTEKLTPKQRAALRADYAEPVRDLEQILGRQMPGWLSD